jgi:hypothetical protein
MSITPDTEHQCNHGESDPREIYLSPSCDPERCWCEDEMDDCVDCSLPSVKYIRADIAGNAVRAEILSMIRHAITARETRAAASGGIERLNALEQAKALRDLVGMVERRDGQ